MARATNWPVAGSVLGPLLFKIYLNDMFFILENIEICYFADDTTPNSKNSKEALTNVEPNCAILVE